MAVKVSVQTASATQISPAPMARTRDNWPGLAEVVASDTVHAEREDDAPQARVVAQRDPAGDVAATSRPRAAEV
jgi:hypothetical protein